MPGVNELFYDTRAT